MADYVPREHVIESDVCGTDRKQGLAERLGWTIIRKLKWIGRRNAMDRFFARAYRKPCRECGARGRVVLIEFKRKGKKPNITQEREIARFRDAGVEVYVVDDLADAREILR